MRVRSCLLSTSCEHHLHLQVLFGPILIEATLTGSFKTGDEASAGKPLLVNITVKAEAVDCPAANKTASCIAAASAAAAAAPMNAAHSI